MIKIPPYLAKQYQDAKSDATTKRQALKDQTTTVEQLRRDTVTTRAALEAATTAFKGADALYRQGRMTQEDYQAKHSRMIELTEDSEKLSRQLKASEIDLSSLDAVYKKAHRQFEIARDTVKQACKDQLKAQPVAAQSLTDLIMLASVDPGRRAYQNSWGSQVPTDAFYRDVGEHLINTLFGGTLPSFEECYAVLEDAVNNSLEPVAEAA